MASEFELAWTVGFLEGEGCFSNMVHHSACVTATQKQKEPLERLQRYFDGSLNLYTQPAGSYWRWVVCGRKAMGLTYLCLSVATA